MRPTKGSVEMWEESFTHEKQAERGAGRRLSEGGGRQRGRRTNMPTIWFGNESRSSLLWRSNFHTNTDNSCCYAKLFFLQNLGWDLYSAVCALRAVGCKGNDISFDRNTNSTSNVTNTTWGPGFHSGSRPTLQHGERDLVQTVTRHFLLPTH